MVQHADSLVSPAASTVFAELEPKRELKGFGGVVVKSVEDVREPSLDPRLSLSSTSRPVLAAPIGNSKNTNESELEKTEYRPRYIEFEQGDARNPINFSRSKKWSITCLACFSTFLASCTASTYNMGFDSMIADLNCTEFQATIGLSLYALGFGIVPLVTASFSEEIGRQPLYYMSATGVLFMYLVIATAHNIQTVLIARFIQGAFGSTWATMVGGTIADIWQSHERGLPMSFFAVAAIGGTGFGPVYAGWVEMNPRLEWRWIQWIQMIITGFYLLLVPIIMKETRSSIILTRIAKKIRKETGDHRYRARIEDERMKLTTLIWISCTRPIHLLITEPVVASFSLWIGFVWGILYCMIESIGLVFSDIHGFNIGQIGTVFLTFIIGSVLGFATNFFQEHLYHRNFGTRGPEARLYLACCAAVLIPCGMFIYAWSTFSHVPWIVLTIGITFVPKPRSDSFPLFTEQMYAKLTFKWANTLFGCIACLLMPIPFILFFYGPAIRNRSRFSRLVMQSEHK
ncbi:MFS polyamine transporter [Gymnopus androsaceus JB14]|uniref:MFS polyamine transporter n=1 Tax=Gymnopus androsaceus JB14 TaxID=1447944 RepID=A0A6A4GSV7_9AGAR|nr:MFS polyamine transporter [Gymnopus androsaceus JB14]